MSNPEWDGQFHYDTEMWRRRAEAAEKLVQELQEAKNNSEWQNAVEIARWRERAEDVARHIEQLRRELDLTQETCDLWKADAEAAQRARDRAETLLEGMILVEKRRRMRETTMRVWADKEPEGAST